MPNGFYTLLLISHNNLALIITLILQTRKCGLGKKYQAQCLAYGKDPLNASEFSYRIFSSLSIAF